MDTSTTPTVEEIRAERRYWASRMKITPNQMKHLKPSFIQQLINCKSDECRRILINARTQIRKET
jgi:hypothetical protein